MCYSNCEKHIHISVLTFYTKQYFYGNSYIAYTIIYKPMDIHDNRLNMRLKRYMCPSLLKAMFSGERVDIQVAIWSKLKILIKIFKQ